MKVIDLLNKIANGEEVPQKIKIGNKIYNYETFNIGKGDNYFTTEWEEVKGYRINYDGTYYYLEIRDYNLNDEVEILEEEKKIPEKLNWKPKESMAGQLTQKEQIEVIARRTEKLKKEFNNLIDYLKSKGE